MPNYEAALPPGAYNIKIVSSSGQEIPVDWSFTRDGKDGAEVIVPLFGGDEFVGEVLEGNWQKGDDGAIQGPFTAKLNGSGSLELSGRSDAGGTWRYGWITTRSKIPLLDDLTIDFHIKLEGHSSSDSYRGECFITDEESGNPWSSNCIYLALQADTTTYKILIQKRVNGTTTTLLNWTTVTNAEGTWRIKFEENKSGHNHTHFFYHDGSGDVNESTDEVSGSPFTLDLAINSGCMAYKLNSTETTNRTVSSDFVRVTYPDFKVVYDLDDDDVSKGDVKVYDTIGSDDESEWQRVLDVNHQFVGDCVVENGLIRLWIDEGEMYGLKLYYWNGNAWSQPIDNFHYYLRTSTKYLRYPRLKRIEKLTVESCQLKLRIHDTASEDADYYVDATLTLERGLYFYRIEFESVNPLQDFSPGWKKSSSQLRFGYVGDAEVHGIADVDLHKTADNTTLSDNFLIRFDNDQDPIIGFMACSEKPNGATNKHFRADQWGYISIRDIASSDVHIIKVFIGLIPFSQISNLFKEAEDATLGSGATVDTTQDDDSGDSVLLDAQGEYVRYVFSGINDLPSGRYIAFIRAKDSSQVADDLQLQVYNETDGRYLNEEKGDVHQTLTADFAYYGVIFDITDDDDGDTIRIDAMKDTADSNNIWIDYFLIVPIGNGESRPQDLAHNAMRSLAKQRKMISH